MLFVSVCVALGLGLPGRDGLDGPGGAGLSIFGAGGGTGLEGAGGLFGDSSRVAGGAAGRLGEGLELAIVWFVSAVFGTSISGGVSTGFADTFAVLGGGGAAFLTDGFLAVIGGTIGGSVISDSGGSGSGSSVCRGTGLSDAGRPGRGGGRNRFCVGSGSIDFFCVFSVASFSRIFDRMMSDGGEVGLFGSLFNIFGAVVGLIGEVAWLSFVSETSKLT